MNEKQLWDGVLTDLELSLSKATFSTWFKNTFISRIEEGVIFIGVPSEFIRQWLFEKYHRLILESLRGRLSETRAIEYIITNEKTLHHNTPPQEFTAKTFLGTQELPLVNYAVNKDDNLNPRYAFNSFIVGSFNELAHAAAQAIIKRPGAAYNPLFIYGDTGHGKTHLMQAIGNALKQQNRAKKIYYITSEKFSNDYTSAILNNRVNTFKDRYRTYDVFIMDDIQFLARKEKTQEELFHLFNTFYNNNRQIVFSSDKHPNQLPDIEARLVSRFAAGMVVEIIQPDHESRAAILKSKAALLGITIRDAILNFLADMIEGNIRELEGVINTIFCKMEVNKRELSLEEVKDLIKENIRPKKIISTKEVITAVTSFYKIDEAIVYEKTRRKEIVKPRQIIMYILREDLNVSYPTIGHLLGGRDHTTVIHSCEKVKNDIKTDPELAQEILHIKTLLK